MSCCVAAPSRNRGFAPIEHGWLAVGFLSSLVECAGSTVEAAATSDDAAMKSSTPEDMFVQTETLKTISRVIT